MTAFMIYLLKVNVIFTVLFIFYMLMLRRDTFYEAKRAILQGIIVVSVLLPFAHVAELIPQRNGIEYIVIFVNDTMGATVGNEPMQLTAAQWVDVVLLAGVVATALVLLFRYAQLFRDIRGCKSVTIDGELIFIPRAEVNPFSFNRRIYLNPEMYNSEEIRRIIEHEKAHINQRHDIDLMVVTLFRLILWMNPLYFMFLNAIRENIEFLADKAVLKLGSDPREYQYTLLKVAQTPALPMTQNFSFSHLKKRIIMMNRKKTHSIWSGKYLLVIPVLLTAVLLVNASELKEAWSNADFAAKDRIPADTTGNSNASNQKTHVILIKTNNDSAQSQPTVIMDGKVVSASVLDTISDGKALKIALSMSYNFNPSIFLNDSLMNAKMALIKDTAIISQGLKTIIFENDKFMKSDSLMALLNQHGDLSKKLAGLNGNLTGINIRFSDKDIAEKMKEWNAKHGEDLKLQLEKYTKEGVNIQMLDEKNIRDLKEKLGKLQLDNMSDIKELQNMTLINKKNLEKLQGDLTVKLSGNGAKKLNVFSTIPDSIAGGKKMVIVIRE